MAASPPPSRAARVVVGLAGLLLFGTIGVTLLRAPEWRRRTLTTSATVIHNRPEKDGAGQPAYRPMLRFVDRKGNLVTAEAAATYNLDDNPRYPAGETVAVRYDPRDPTCVRIDSLLDRWAVPLLCALAAAAACIFLMLPPRRPRPPELAATA